MKRTASFAAAVALMCGTGALAQTSSPVTPSEDMSTTAPEGAAQAGSGPAVMTPATAGASTGAESQAGASPTTQGGADSGMTSTSPGDPAVAEPGTEAAGTQMTAAGMTAPAGNFGEFDKDGDGQLTPYEFARLVMGSQSSAALPEESAPRNMKAQKSAVEALNKAADQFAKHDTNRDGRVSQGEFASSTVPAQ